MPKQPRSSPSSDASPMTPSSSGDQTELEERKARKRIQNRMAQRLYRKSVTALCLLNDALVLTSGQVSDKDKGLKT